MKKAIWAIIAAFLLLQLATAAQAQVVGPAVRVPLLGSGGGGSSTITSGTTATSGCTDGGFLYSLTSLIRCGANAINDGSIITLGGVAGSGENVIITNGTSTRNILCLRDNVTCVVTVADGGATTFTQNVRAPRFEFNATNYVDQIVNIIRIVGTSSAITVGGSDSASLLLGSGANGTSGQVVALRGYNGSAWSTGVSVANTSSGALTVAVNGNLTLERTVTAAATTGAQTIDKQAGSVNFAAAATTLVVTNALANATSLIFLTPQTADTACTSFSAVRGVGSFTITANAACAAETAVAFWVTN